MRQGETLTCEIERSDLDGAGRADVAGVELAVSGAFAGERIEARVTQVNRRGTRGRARALRVLRPHSGRREAPCEHHPERGGRCDGCALMPLSLEAQRRLKRDMLGALGLAVERVEGAAQEWGYRYSAKRVAFGRAGGLWLGSYQRGSHRGASMRHCAVDHPRLAQAAAWIEDAAREARVEAYDDRTGGGDLRYVWLRTNGDDVLATLVTARSDSVAAARLPARLPAALGLAHSVQAGASNTMRGDAARWLRRPAPLCVPLAGRSVEIGPLGFLQPNPEVAAQCYAALLGPHVPGPSGRALDLYAGAGITRALLGERFPDVVSNELHPEGAAAVGSPPETAEACLARHVAADSHFDLVIANPPRAGLGADVCSRLRELDPPRIHLMSCGPGGLARDLARLTADGRYQLVSLRAFDTLPQTPHVELVAQLRRAVG